MNLCVSVGGRVTTRLRKQRRVRVFVDSAKHGCSERGVGVRCLSGREDLGNSRRRGRIWGASGAPFCVDRVDPFSSEMWEEDKSRGRGRAVCLVLRFLPVHGPLTLLPAMPVLPECMGASQCDLE